MSPRTVVVGGGLAGLTAALGLADRGEDVLLLEARPRLGGLTSSFPRDTAGTRLVVDTGQHVFLRCCTDYRALLDRLGVTDRVHLQDRLTIPVARPRPGALDGTPLTSTLRRSALPAPMHLAGALARYRLMSPTDRLQVARAALALRRVDPADPAVDQESFGAWLARHGQGECALRSLWDLIGVAALNAPAGSASLALAATVFKIGLLTDAAAADVGWSRVPLQELHGTAAAAALAAAGAEVRTATKVTELERTGAGWTLRTRTAGTAGTERADQVVLAVPPAAAEALAPEGAVPLTPGWAARLGTAPIVNVHVVFDRTVLEGPFLAAVDSPVQWVFDRTVPSGLAAAGGHGTAPRGALSGPQYLAVSLSAAQDVVGLPAGEVLRRVLPALSEVLPAARRAEVVDAFVTREREATFDPAPGQAASRPPNRTAAPGLVLAGAWTDTGWPATMEGAVRSGNGAVSALEGARRPTVVAA